MCLALPIAGVSGAGAATYYVDGANPSATDSGPGTEAIPYRTISAAVSQRGGPGTTVYVKPGVYPEQVSVGASGASGSPFVIQALGAPVIVDGADDFGAPGLWTQASGNTWLASAVTWMPGQVFADGVRLATTSAAPGSMPAGTFQYVDGTGLYVNAGGGNPASHGARVGRRLYGFKISSKSWVTIAGFVVTRQESRGFNLSGCDNIEIQGNTVTFANGRGISLSSCTGGAIVNNGVSDHNDHGIALTSVNGATVRNNDSFRNARPSVRAANGIYLYGSAGNRIEGNLLHHNQDTGLQINSSSNNNVCLQNRSWSNGDHGYDHLGSTGTQHIGDVAWGNYKDGFSIEGSAVGTQLFNCIATENGLTTGEYDLWIDSSSANGFVSDYNIFWNSTSQNPIKFISTQYGSVAAYSATSGEDVHTIQADPRFENPEAGDFRPRAGSPAIDAANALVPNWPTLDAEGHARFDDPATPNTGAGTPRYADRGALERRDTGSSTALPPVASLTATPASGTAPLLVVADGSDSSDPDGSIQWYRFDFGDGTVVAQTAPIAGKTFSAGTWTVTLTVTDNSGLTAVATQVVTVAPAPADRPPVVTAPTSTTATEGVALTVAVTAADPDGNTIASLAADLSRLPAGSGATFVANATRTAGTLAWTPEPGTAGSYTVTFTASNSLSGSATTTINVSAPPPTGDGNLVTNPGFETGLDGWSPNGGPTIARVAGGHSGGYAVEARGPTSSTASFGINDNPNWIKTVAGAGARYHFTAWVRSASSTGRAKLKVREYLNGLQQGSTAYSSQVSLSPAWQRLDLDYVARTTGSTIDFTVLDSPRVAGEVFQIDDVSITLVTAAAAPAVAEPVSAAPGAVFSARLAPAPVRFSAELKFTTTRPGPAKIGIYDVSGRRVHEALSDPDLPAGAHRVTLRSRAAGGPIGPGVFFYRLEAAEGVRTGRFVILE